LERCVTNPQIEKRGLNLRSWKEVKVSPCIILQPAICNKNALIVLQVEMEMSSHASFESFLYIHFYLNLGTRMT